jgi:hypothetical protein
MADDNAMLYKMLDTATKSSSYNSTLKAFVENENGVASYEALYKDYGGNAKWEKQYSALQQSLASRKWKSTGPVTIAAHTSFHRDCHHKMVRAATHIDVTVPNDRQRCMSLISSIDSTHPDVSAHLSTINSDPDGMGSDFERTAEHLMTSDPVEKSISKSKKITISSTLGGKGDTGVEFRWYTMKEYKTLSEPQKIELGAWRSSEIGKASMAASKKAYDLKRKNVSGVNTTKPNKKRKTTKFSKAVQAAATRMLTSVVASAKAETDANNLLQDKVNQLQISSVASAASGEAKAKAASVTFADDHGQLLMNKLNSIVGRVHGKSR